MIRSFSQPWFLLGVVALVGMFSPQSTGVALGTEGASASGPPVGPTITKSSVQELPRSEVVEISERIDDLVVKLLKENDQKLNPLASDEVFLRRAYLDIVGRIPTLAETRSFLNDSDPNKRQELIDELLDSYGYVSRQFNFWADLLRIKSRMPGQLSGDPYIDYVKDSLEQNLPYDEFVRQMIAAEGANLKRGNGAVGYHLRDRNMPEDNMSNTIRLFLGTRLECAQCHDHPFDKWTQRQYYEMVAFSGGINYRLGNYQKSFNSLKRKRDTLDETQRRIYQQIFRIASYGVSGSGTGLARLPEGYMSNEEGYTGDIVTAKTMFEGKVLLQAAVTDSIKKRNRKKARGGSTHIVRGAQPIGSRIIYAGWLTSAENPRFAKVIANRLWKQAMGLGLIEPVDVIEDNTVASNPELMEFLTQTMIELDFDMKQFLRAIYNSRTYQAEAHDSDVLVAKDFLFPGPVVRRMSAEQIWDSMLTLTIDGIDQRHRPSTPGIRGFAADPYEAYEKITAMSAEKIEAFVDELAASGIYNRKNRAANMKMMQMEMERSDPEIRDLKSERKQIAQDLKQAKRNKDTARVRELMVAQANNMMQSRKRGRQANNYLRASEMISPARPGHFLREFGQSDREQIDNSNTEPAVTQVLSMMNGYVEERISRDPGSLLMQSVLTASTRSQCVDIIFLSMLNRYPTTEERRIWEPEFKPTENRNNGEAFKTAYSDLIWTLANSNEFIFVK